MELAETVTPPFPSSPATSRLAPVPGRLFQPAVDACENRRWSLLLFPRSGEARGLGPVTWAPFRCRSWRCRRCAWEVARDDYRRVARASLSRSWWLYAVLTFDPSHWSGGPWEAYRAASRLWDKRLRRRIERQHGRLEYLQTWERTRREWPHMNLLLRSESLEAEVRSLPSERRWAPEGDRGRGRWAHWSPWRRWLARAAPASGFGSRVWVEIVDCREALAAYLVKIATEFSRSAFKIGDQRPLGAPSHFRRLRASRGLLPPRTRARGEESIDPDTGEIQVRLRAVELSPRLGTQTAIIASIPPDTWERRSPTWTDVGAAREFQYRAAKKRALRGPSPPRYE